MEYYIYLYQLEPDSPLSPKYAFIYYFVLGRTVRKHIYILENNHYTFLQRGI